MEGEAKIKIRKTRMYIIWTVIAVFFLLIMGFIFINQPLKPVWLTEKIDGKVKVDSSFEIQFDWPVSRQVELTFEPEVAGELTYKNMVIDKHFSRTVVFTPELNFWPDTAYKVTVSNVKNVLPSFLPAQSHTFTFTTESLPKIKSVAPQVSEEINADAEFSLVLDKPYGRLLDFEYRVNPVIDLTSQISEDGKTIVLKPKIFLSQGRAYQISVWQKKVRYLYKSREIGFQSEPESIWAGEYKVREAPFLSAFSPNGENVGLNEEIKITFNEAVESDSFKNSVVITPAMPGSWESEDQKTYTLKNAVLAKDTTYTVKINQGLKTIISGYFTEDAIQVFKTAGPAKAAFFSPSEGATGVSVSRSLSVTFDQAVDHSSTQSHFSLTPAVEGNFTWDGETLSFKPNTPLAFNTAYKITVGSGIKSLVGFDSETDYNINFTTELSQTKLAVPFHRQEHNLSCETATLVMALAYRGIKVTEAAIIDFIGFDPTPKSGGVWGNPNVAFVGNIDGHQPQTGYGVYWDPIARAAKQYRTAYAFTGWGIADLTGQILKNNPVIVWGTAGSGKRIDWKTSAGGLVVAVRGEHTRVVVGFIGASENPSKIITLDPLSGIKYFTTADFLWNWGLLGRSGVVVE